MLNINRSRSLLKSREFLVIELSARFYRLDSISKNFSKKYISDSKFYRYLIGQLKILDLLISEKFVIISTDLFRKIFKISN